MADPLHKKGERKVMIRPTEEWEKRSGEVTEGPFMLKHKSTYYLTYSGTGADSPNYGIGYATSKSAAGPFVKYAGNPMRARSTRAYRHECRVHCAIMFWSSTKDCGFSEAHRPSMQCVFIERINSFNRIIN